MRAAVQSSSFSSIFFCIESRSFVRVYYVLLYTHTHIYIFIYAHHQSESEKLFKILFIMVII